MGICRLQRITAVVVSALAVLVLTQSASADEAKRLPGLYMTDMVDAQLYAPLQHDTGTTPGGLPVTTPFNADMVNVENIVGDGENVYVAILDTGLLPPWPFFFSEADIAMEYCKGFTHDLSWDATLEDIVIGPLEDDRGCITDLASGHGTHVTSTVVGFNFRNSEWVRGIAPHATIIPVLVLDAWVVDTPFGPIPLSGGTDEMIAEGIKYVADLDLDGRVVINMSLGGPDRSPLIEAAVDYAISKGVVVVASAGNSGSNGMGYPGGLPQIISTAAAGWAQMFAAPNSWRGDVPENPMSNDILGNNTQYYLEDFSSRPNKALGQKHQDLDVAGPGAWVVGPYKSAFANNTSYFFLSGTSMSAPHVSSIAAMLLGQEPMLSHGEVERRLRNAGHGNPLPADGAIVAFPFNADGFYIADWDGGDYGTGFLRADHVVN